MILRFLTSSLNIVIKEKMLANENFGSDRYDFDQLRFSLYTSKIQLNSYTEALRSIRECSISHQTIIA